MAEPIFVGGAREKTFDNGGKIVNLSFKLEDLEGLKQYFNKAGYCNVDLKWGRNGKPYMQVNMYGVTGEAVSERIEEALPAPPADDLPF